jgi:hypothetical protein
MILFWWSYSCTIYKYTYMIFLIYIFYYKLVKDDLIEDRYNANELFNQFMHVVLDLLSFIKQLFFIYMHLSKV